jgi:hypothetical protein
MFTVKELFRLQLRVIVEINVIKLRIMTGLIIGIPTPPHIHGFNLISKIEEFQFQFTQSNRTDIPVVIFWSGHSKDRMIARHGLVWINEIHKT